MTEDDIRHLLTGNDQPSAPFFPPRFDREAAISRAFNLGKLVETRLQKTVSVAADFPPRDATFHAEVSFSMATDVKSLVTIRLSNFGGFATILNSTGVPQESLRPVLEALSEMGYVYIPAKLLNEAYTGNISDVDTWMTRFFAHI
jgi:hypothetical protein